MLKLAEKAGLAKLGHVALDGTKIKANASRHKVWFGKPAIASNTSMAGLLGPSFKPRRTARGFALRHRGDEGPAGARRATKPTRTAPELGKLMIITLLRLAGRTVSDTPAVRRASLTLGCEAQRGALRRLRAAFSQMSRSLAFVNPEPRLRPDTYAEYLVLCSFIQAGMGDVSSTLRTPETQMFRSTKAGELHCAFSVGRLSPFGDCFDATIARTDTRPWLDNRP